MKKYACSCGLQFDTTKEMVKHYRRIHPADGYQCWDQIGELGDDFANAAMEACWNENHRLGKELGEAKKKIERAEAILRRNSILERFISLMRFHLEDITPHG
jgi:hypothetical protein